jgi:hypothetical protein
MVVEIKSWLAIPKDTAGREVEAVEGSSCIIKFDLEDPETGLAIPAADVNIAQMWLFDEDNSDGVTLALIDPATEDPIDGLDVSSSIDVNGAFRYNLLAAYNMIVDITKNEEVHYARFLIEVDAVVGGEVHTLDFLYRITVDNNPHR